MQADDEATQTLLGNNIVVREALRVALSLSPLWADGGG